MNMEPIPIHIHPDIVFLIGMRNKKRGALAPLSPPTVQRDMYLWLTLFHQVLSA